MKIIWYIIMLVLLTSFSYALSINAPETIEVYAGDNFTISIEGGDFFMLEITEPCYSSIENGTAPMDVIIYVRENASSSNQTCLISATYWQEPAPALTELGSGASSGRSSRIRDTASLPIQSIQPEDESIDDINESEDNIPDETYETPEQQEQKTQEKVKWWWWLLFLLILIVFIIVGITYEDMFSIKRDKC
jgi:hypothetical protein